MNAPFPYPALAERQAIFAENYAERAMAIVNRVMPRKPRVHGWDDPVGFMEAARHDHQRNLLYWRTYARLRAKCEGGKPYITMPKACSALIGGAMHQVSRELAFEAVSLGDAA